MGRAQTFQEYVQEQPMDAAPADGLPADPNEPQLRLLSVSYERRKSLSEGGDELVRAEAHVAPDDEPELVLQTVRRWVLGQLSLNPMELEDRARDLDRLVQDIRNLERLKGTLEAKLEKYGRIFDRLGLARPAELMPPYDLPF